MIFAVVVAVLGVEMIVNGAPAGSERGRADRGRGGATTRSSAGRAPAAGGVLVAAALVLAGGIVYLVHHAQRAGAGRPFAGEPDELREVGGIVRAAARAERTGLIMRGLLVLIATPVLRVAGSLVAFVHQRDRTYVVLTAFVLLLLLASMLGGSGRLGLTE